MVEIDLRLVPPLADRCRFSRRCLGNTASTDTTTASHHIPVFGIRSGFVWPYRILDRSFGFVQHTVRECCGSTGLSVALLLSFPLPVIIISPARYYFTTIIFWLRLVCMGSLPPKVNGSISCRPSCPHFFQKSSSASPRSGTPWIPFLESTPPSPLFLLSPVLSSHYSPSYFFFSPSILFFLVFFSRPFHFSFFPFPLFFSFLFLFQFSFPWLFSCPSTSYQRISTRGFLATWPTVFGQSIVSRPVLQRRVRA